MKLRKTALLLPMLLATVSHAEFVVYGESERDNWFTDAGGAAHITTIGFTGLPNNSSLTDQYAPMGLNFEGTNFITLDVPSFADDWGLRIFDGNDLFFDEPINWIASDYLGSVRMELYLGDTLLFEFQRPLPEQFSGVISDVAFDRVRVFDPTDNLTVIDDLHFGPPISVPAPGAFAPLAFVQLITRRRRRRKSMHTTPSRRCWRRFVVTRT